jgi:hypothetical protein
MVNREGTILHKTDHKCRRIHDYEIFKNKYPRTTLPQVENIINLGYIGVQNDFPTVKSVLYCHLERKRKVNSQMKKRDTIESIPK